MATDMRQLQGEIIQNPESQEQDVERLLVGFLRALIAEQKNDPNSARSQEAPREIADPWERKETL